MERTHIIEEYINGNIKGLRRKVLNCNKKFLKKVTLYKSIDKIMKIQMMVSDAELEMRNKNIDSLAFSLVKDWINSHNEENSINKFLNVSMS